MSIIIRLQNLPLEANSLDIRRFFQGLHIPDGGVHIVGGNQGDAFIAFGSDEDARQAMERNGNLIKSSRIKLLLSSRNEMQRVIDAVRNQTKMIPPVNVQPQVPQSAPKPMISSATLQQPMPSAHNNASSHFYQSQPNNAVGPFGSNPSDKWDSNRPNYRERSRSRSRSPKNRFEDQEYQSSNRNINPMSSGLAGSLIQMSQPAQMPQYSQNAPNNLDPFKASGPSAPINPNYQKPPPETMREQSLYASGDDQSYRSGGQSYGEASNNYNDYPPKYPLIPDEQRDRWNHTTASNTDYRDHGTANDPFRKLDSMPSTQQQNVPLGSGNNSYSQSNSGFNQMNQEPYLHPPQPMNAPNNGSTLFPTRLFTIQLFDLPYNVRNEDLIKFFHPLFLNDERIKLFYDEKGFPTGVGLARFSSPREFETALSYNNRFLLDRQVQIRPFDEINGPQPNYQMNSSAKNSGPILPQQSMNSPLMPTPTNPPIGGHFRPSENYPPYQNSPDDIGGFQRPPPLQYEGPPPSHSNFSPLQPQPVDRKELVLYMKGLPYSNCTKKDVADFFEPINLANIEIEADSRGKPTGNAFVEFKDLHDCDRGMEYNMRHMGKRYIELIPLLIVEKYGPNYHMPSTAPPPKHRSSKGPPFGNHPPITYCVSVKGLSKHVTSKDLKSFFSKINAETYAIHILFTSDRLNAGEALIEFLTKEKQRRALDCDGDLIGHDRLIIRAIPYEVVRNAIQQPPPQLGHRGPSDYGGPYSIDSPKSHSKHNSRFNDRSSKFARSNVPPFFDKATILLATNISMKAIDEDLCVFFSDYKVGLNQIKLRVVPDGKDQSKEAQISFHCKADAERAQRVMNMKYFLDRKIHLKFL